LRGVFQVTGEGNKGISHRSLKNQRARGKERLGNAHVKAAKREEKNSLSKGSCRQGRPVKTSDEGRYEELSSEYARALRKREFNVSELVPESRALLQIEKVWVGLSKRKGGRADSMESMAYISINQALLSGKRGKNQALLEERLGRGSGTRCAKSKFRSGYEKVCRDPFETQHEKAGGYTASQNASQREPSRERSQRAKKKRKKEEKGEGKEKKKGKGKKKKTKKK